MEKPLDIQADARRAFEIMKAGGIAIHPNDTGYALGGMATDALRRIFVAKRRGDHKRNAMLADLETQRILHRLGKREQAMVNALVLESAAIKGVDVVEKGSLLRRRRSKRHHRITFR